MPILLPIARRAALATVENDVVDGARAEELDSTDAEIPHLRAWLLNMSEDRDGAIEANARSLSIDPYRAITLGNQGGLFLIEGRLEDSGILLDSAISMAFNPAHAGRALQRLAVRDVPGARRDAEAILPTDSLRSRAALALVLAAEGRGKNAEVERVDLFFYETFLYALQRH